MICIRAIKSGKCRNPKIIENFAGFAHFNKNLSTGPLQSPTETRDRNITFEGVSSELSVELKTAETTKIIVDKELVDMCFMIKIYFMWLADINYSDILFLLHS